MGRGRAKAKQAKVARALKYSTAGTDLARLEAELAGQGGADDAEFDDEEEADEELPGGGSGRAARA